MDQHQNIHQNTLTAIAMNQQQKTMEMINTYDNKKSYETNSYEPTDYTDKNRYEPTTSYGMNDKKYQKTYGKDNNSYKSQYQSSYKPDYKPQYQSYGKDDRDKSKDSSISLKKIKCINTNLNIKGNNAGNVSIGNKGQAVYAEEGYSGTYSSDNGGYGGEGYSKQDKGFDCVINNNNINNNFGNEPTLEPLTCEECFTANATLAGIITDILEITGDFALGPEFPGVIIDENVETIAQFCDFFEEQILAGNIEQTVADLDEVFSIIVGFDVDISASVSSESIRALAYVYQV
jgi:hypothetical protein